MEPRFARSPASRGGGLASLCRGFCPTQAASPEVRAQSLLVARARLPSHRSPRPVYFDRHACPPPPSPAVAPVSSEATVRREQAGRSNPSL